MDGSEENTTPIEGFISPAKNEFESEESKTLSFVVTNTSDQDVKVLTWYTPLEGFVNGHDENPIESPCLLVTNNGEVVEYDGKLKKRQPIPPEEAYVTLGAGESLSVDFDVNQAYQVSIPGEYSVAFVGKPDSEEGSIEFKYVSDSAGEDEENAAPREQKLGMPEANFTVKGSPEGEAGEAPQATRPTQGDLMRAGESVEGSQPDEKKDEAPASTGETAGAKAPIIVGEPSEQRKQETITAHNDGYGLVVATLAALGDNPNFLEWFGIFDTPRFDGVVNNYTVIRDTMQTTTFTYNLSGDGCDPGVFAYTFKGATTVWMCGAFWQALPLGTDSKAGTVVHELSHSIVRTDDIVYGQSRCRQLALSNPVQAVKNADSHEYFSGG